MKIKLGDLEKQLFPEYYPYFYRHFDAELDYLKSVKVDDKTRLQNISFKLRLVNSCLAIKDQKLRESLYFVFQNLFSKAYDYERLYDWKDLKVILCFIILFRDVKNQKDFEKRLKANKTTMIFRKYFKDTISF